jgi:hypothetical protein
MIIGGDENREQLRTCGGFRTRSDVQHNSHALLNLFAAVGT